jgi:hypothetical protein
MSAAQALTMFQGGAATSSTPTLKLKLRAANTAGTLPTAAPKSSSNSKKSLRKKRWLPKAVYEKKMELLALIFGAKDDTNSGAPKAHDHKMMGFLARFLAGISQDAWTKKLVRAIVETEKNHSNGEYSDEEFAAYEKQVDEFIDHYNAQYKKAIKMLNASARIAEADKQKLDAKTLNRVASQRPQ